MCYVILKIHRTKCMYSDKQHETYVNVFQLFYFSLDQDKVIHSPKNGHRTHIYYIYGLEFQKWQVVTKRREGEGARGPPCALD